MKLKKIKLAGFKSFIDLTTVTLAGNLTGIVGPNGCGKSNIIDALRWVMGEVSAKQLRSEQMSDVIFNGSSVRKAAGRASVELIFDNTEMAFGGEYAKYHEISIRREVSRDQGSDYYLNGNLCRRKDIINLFLGTGLGSNSYAVIEQGVVVQFIDANPMELRAFVEEASGVSRYRERRRETESRIKHTRENLLRFNDILGEVNKQLKNLESQANAAKRYESLKRQERTALAQIQLLHYQNFSKKVEDKENTVHKKKQELEDLAANLQLEQSLVAALKERQKSATENFNSFQEEYYRLTAELTKLEEEIKYVSSRSLELTQQSTKVAGQISRLELAKQENLVKLKSLLSDKEALAGSLAERDRNCSLIKQQLLAGETEEMHWQKLWDDFSLEQSGFNQNFEITKARVENLELLLEDENQQLVVLRKDLGSIDLELALFNQQQSVAYFDQHQLKYDTCLQEENDRQAEIEAKKKEIEQLTADFERSRKELQQLTERKASVEALQIKELDKGTLSEWLKKNGLDNQRHLFDLLDVEPGWERAVELVLGRYLKSVCVKSLDDFKDLNFKDNLGIELILLEISSDQNEVAFNLNEQLVGSELLADKISDNVLLKQLVRLQGVYLAANLEQALGMRRRLRQWESLATQDGYWLGRNWLRRLADNQENNPGVFKLRNELVKLQQQIQEKTSEVMVLNAGLAEVKLKLAELEDQLRVGRDKLLEVASGLGELQAKVASEQLQFSYLQNRVSSLNDEIIQREDKVAQLKFRLEEAKQQQTHISNEQHLTSKRSADLIEAKEQLKNKLILIRDDYQAVEAKKYQLHLQLQSVDNQLDFLSKTTQQNQDDLGGLLSEQQELKQALAETTNLELIKENLQQRLGLKLELEKRLTAVKVDLAKLEEELAKNETTCYQRLQELDLVKKSLETEVFELQEVQLRSGGYKEQILESGYNIETLKETLDEGVTVEIKKEELAKLAKKLEFLGVVNLTAVAELTKQQERKSYLDAQHQDLINALSSLEAAISKIDREAKAKFDEAYEIINKKFQEFFPKVFGGGSAALEKIVDKSSNVGISVMARPPGKKNASIASLSGGEKALTAMALIFAFFQLNPAPFCVLDEVDAPLDDYNAVRFCNLVKEMSGMVQFIFVTHNKLTMELAEQLIGVTMREPGVSRIVAVDLEKAVSMAGD